MRKRSSTSQTKRGDWLINNIWKHGPYQYLSYTFQGKSHTEFVRAVDVTKTREAIENYDQLMALVEELVETSIKLARLEKKEKK